jgi:hypothetical protein
MVMPCRAWDGCGPLFWTLALVGKETEHMGCDAGTAAWELRPDAGLGLDVQALALPYGGTEEARLDERWLYV